MCEHAALRAGFSTSARPAWDRPRTVQNESNRVCIFQEQVCIFPRTCQKTQNLLKVISDGLKWKSGFWWKVALHIVKINKNVTFWWKPHNKRINIGSFSTYGFGLGRRMGSTFSKNVENQRVGRKNYAQKSSKLGRFGGWWLATGSYSVEMKRTTSRKLFRHLPGLQDPTNVKKRRKYLICLLYTSDAADE